VCNPDPRNITQIFIPLTKFIEEIEHAIGCTPGRPCTLNAFLSDYIKEVFLGRHHMMVAAGIECATKSVDAWRATTNPEVMRGLGLSRPLLQVSHSCAAFSTLVPHFRVLKEDFPLLKSLT
jgi:exocyst complex component 4